MLSLAGEISVMDSPESSNGSHSGHGSTPETKATAISPNIADGVATMGAPKLAKVPLLNLSSALQELPTYFLRGFIKGGETASVDPFVEVNVGEKRLKGGESIMLARNRSSEQKLSPMASSFTPFALSDGLRDARSRPLQGDYHLVASTASSYKVPANADVTAPDSFVRGSDPYISRHPMSVTLKTSGASYYGNHNATSSNVTSPSASYDSDQHQYYSGTSASSSKYPVPIPIFYGVGASISRAITLTGVKNVTVDELSTLFKISNFPTVVGPVYTDLTTHETVYVGFWDIRDSEKAVAEIRNLHPEWQVGYSSTVQFALKLSPEHSGRAFTFTTGSNVIATGIHTGRAQEFDSSAIQRLLQELLMNYGDIHSFKALGSQNLGCVRIYADFFDIRAAGRAISALSGFKVNSCIVEVSMHNGSVRSSDLFKEASPLYGELDRIRIGHGVANVARFDRSPTIDSHPYSSDNNYLRQNGTLKELRPISGRPAPSCAAEILTQHGRATYHHPPEVSYHHRTLRGAFDPLGTIGEGQVYLESLRHLGAHYSPQQRGSARASRRDEYSSGHHNVVDIERISQGLDVRTTIMLRNIPNRIEEPLLRSIIDETSAAKYDFLYLRIDFANNCNVGYAFINFVDPVDIIDFVRARAGRRWNRFNSDKVAEVSYATIQGKDCLVQKFRNSSVMLECPSFRPKIFHTGTGSDAGKEAPFPGPDNPSKMRRSVENAEHVGLFAPRAGQYHRDERRRRRSQYDRGTPLAEIEEAYELDYETHRDRGSPRRAASRYAASLARSRTAAGYFGF